MVNVEYNTFAAAILWDTNKWRYPYSPGEMLQRCRYFYRSPTLGCPKIGDGWEQIAESGT